VARKIHSLGGIPKVFLLGDPARFRGASALNFGILKRLPVDMRPADDLAEIRKYLAEAEAAVDALLGTGLDREVEGLTGRPSISSTTAVAGSSLLTFPRASTVTPVKSWAPPYGPAGR
jgi:NAD(P)H-hydrate repair Nnr-like enzyme with NAD(P)H-hydrate epimerase domain